MAYFLPSEPKPVMNSLLNLYRLLDECVRMYMYCALGGVNEVELHGFVFVTDPLPYTLQIMVYT